MVTHRRHIHLQASTLVGLFKELYSENISDLLYGKSYWQRLLEANPRSGCLKQINKKYKRRKQREEKGHFKK